MSNKIIKKPLFKTKPDGGVIEKPDIKHSFFNLCGELLSQTLDTSPLMNGSINQFKIWYMSMSPSKTSLSWNSTPPTSMNGNSEVSITCRILNNIWARAHKALLICPHSVNTPQKKRKQGRGPKEELGRANWPRYNWCVSNNHNVLIDKNWVCLCSQIFRSPVCASMRSEWALVVNQWQFFHV